MTCEVGDELSLDTAIAVYFCCLEAVQNAAKHAAAHRVVVRVERDADDVTFSVADDGRGFDPGVDGGGSGLGNLLERLGVLGGTAGITSTPRGTTVTGRLPYVGPLAAVSR